MKTKLTNDYAAATAGYKGTPKAVFAALAYSLALRLESDSHDAARRLLSDEWAALHAAGIVPQKPPQKSLHLLT